MLVLGDLAGPVSVLVQHGVLFLVTLALALVLARDHARTRRRLDALEQRCTELEEGRDVDQTRVR